MKKRPPGDGGADPRASWNWLYASGSVMALLYIIMVVVPLVLIFTTPQPPATGGAAILGYIASHKAIYMTELICFVGLSVPALGVFLAVSVSLRDAHRSLAALGGLIGIASEVVALSLGSSPQSLSGSLVYLSDQYGAAATDVQRASLAGAAEGFLASANAVSSAGILTALGILALSVCMLRGTWSRAVAVLGIVTGLAGVVCEALRPRIGPVYGIYGLLLPAWFLCVGIRLYRMGFAPASRR